MNKVHTIVVALVLLRLTCLGSTEIAHAQNLTNDTGADLHRSRSLAEPCQDSSIQLALKEAMQQVCSRPRVEPSHYVRRAIILGFVGGYVKRDDTNHPEVLFAQYLQNRYGAAAHVEVFGNHKTEKALDDTISYLSDQNRLSTPLENGQVRIILYGHSWGASQVLAVARGLERRHIPVALTVQIDSVRKFGQNDGVVPVNVAKAVNYFQSHGLTPGRPKIVPADATRTQILGNYQMEYKKDQVNCGNYRWPSRVFNKGHHQIENDPQVWKDILSLIDTELLVPRGEAPSVSYSDSPAFK